MAPSRGGVATGPALELDVALLGDRGLLNGDHLPLHLSELGGGLLVATDKEGCRPEDDDRRCGRHAILCALTILSARQRRRAR
ncbi:hypothetical protein [Bradyrhizobium sp. RDM12]